MRQICPACRRPLPLQRSEPTSRELDVIFAWWVSKSVRQAAADVGLTYQRAKNILASCRLRSGVRSNDELVHLHLELLRSRMGVALPQITNVEEAA